jgi:23S rRNA (guanine1835-N2)-methyltransferase
MNSLAKNYDIKRYDLSEDKSLRSWSAADEYLLQAFSALENKPDHLAIYNDRFGFLGCHLHSATPTLIITHKSQEKAIDANLKAHNISGPNFLDPLSSFDKKMDLALVKMPKSLGLFQLFLEQITHNSTSEVTVICGFMTRHFSPRILDIAQSYFEVVEQSRAVKKARILTLTTKKKPEKRNMITSLTYKDQEYRQYPGVFSADHIDYATQLLLEHLEIKENDQCVLDLASGNGIIGSEIHKRLPHAELHLMDDDYLAVSSAKLNIQGKNIHHHFNNDLSIFKNDTFDMIVTNPPFHFEYEINTKVAIELFKGCF